MADDADDGKENSTFTRRGAMKTGGALAGGAALGAFGFSTMGAAQTASSNLNIVDPQAITTDDGSILYVEASGDIVTQWDGFDDPVEAYQIKMQAYYPDVQGTGRSSIYQSGRTNLPTSKQGTNGSFTQSFKEVAVATDGRGNYDTRDGNNGDGFNTQYGTSLSVGPLEADTDGGQNQTKVMLNAIVYLYGGEQIHNPSASGAFTVTVNNEESTETVTGDVYYVDVVGDEDKT